jgi:hypothetical protein
LWLRTSLIAPTVLLKLKLVSFFPCAGVNPPLPE